MKSVSILLCSTNTDTYINCERFKYILLHYIIKMQTTRPIIHGYSLDRLLLVQFYSHL